MKLPLKPIDLTAAALETAMRVAGVDCAGASEALTCRWAVLAPLDDPQHWLAPAVGAWDGLCAGLRLTGIGARPVVPPGSSANRLASALATADRPMIVGPAAAPGHGPSLPHWHAGEASFFVVLDRGGGDACRVDDPRGWPGVWLSVSVLAGAIAVGGGGVLAIGPDRAEPGRTGSPGRMAAEAARLAGRGGTGGGAAMTELVRLLTAQPPVGRAARALAVALPLFAGRRFQLAAFLADGGAPPRLVDALQAQVGAAGRAGAALAGDNGAELARWLSAMAKAEADVEQGMAELAAGEETA